VPTELICKIITIQTLELLKTKTRAKANNYQHKNNHAIIFIEAIE